MIKPTKKNQKQWVKDHLNGGSFPEGIVAYRNELRNSSNHMGNHACYDAMVWLDENNIKSLEEAWDKCPNVDWIDWMLDWMDLTNKEQDYIFNAYDESWNSDVENDNVIDELRKRIPNPWKKK